MKLTTSRAILLAGSVNLALSSFLFVTPSKAESLPYPNEIYFAQQAKLTVCHFYNGNYTQEVFAGNDAAANYYSSGEPTNQVLSPETGFSLLDIIPPDGYSGVAPALTMPPSQQILNMISKGTFYPQLYTISFSRGAQNWTPENEQLWKNNCVDITESHHPSIKHDQNSSLFNNIKIRKLRRG